MVLHWSLSDSKSPQVSRTRLRILAVLSNAVNGIVSTRSPISKSSRPFNSPLVIMPNAPITIGPIVIFMFHSFLNSLAMSRYLSFFSLSFRFIPWSVGTAKLTIIIIIIIICFCLICIRNLYNEKIIIPLKTINRLDRNRLVVELRLKSLSTGPYYKETNENAWLKTWIIKKENSMVLSSRYIYIYIYIYMCVCVCVCVCVCLCMCR